MGQGGNPGFPEARTVPENKFRAMHGLQGGPSRPDKSGAGRSMRGHVRVRPSRKTSGELRDARAAAIRQAVLQAHSTLGAGASILSGGNQSSSA